jgi:hypothetical protein
MPGVETVRAAGCDAVSLTRTVSSGAGAYPANRERRTNRLGAMLRGLLAGLNKLLDPGDFSRGEVCRD